MRDQSLMDVANEMHVACVDSPFLTEVERGHRNGGDPRCQCDFSFRIYEELSPLGDELVSPRFVLTWMDGVCGQWAVIARSLEKAQMFVDLLEVVCKYGDSIESVREFADAPGCGG